MFLHNISQLYLSSECNENKSQNLWHALYAKNNVRNFACFDLSNFSCEHYAISSYFLVSVFSISTSNSRIILIISKLGNTNVLQLEIILVLRLQDYKIFIESQRFLLELKSVFAHLWTFLLTQILCLYRTLTTKHLNFIDEIDHKYLLL